MVDRLGLALSDLSAHDPLGRIGCDVLLSQLARELEAPPSERRLPDVQPDTALAHCLHDHVNVRMSPLGVQDESVPVLGAELFSKKGPGGRQESARGCPLRHAEDDFVHELWQSPCARGRQLESSPILFQIQIHLLHEAATEAGSPHYRAGVRLEPELSTTRNVIQVLADGAEIVRLGRGDPDDHLGRAPNSAFNLFNLLGGESHGALPTVAAIVRESAAGSGAAQGSRGLTSSPRGDGRCGSAYCSTSVRACPWRSGDRFPAASPP